MTIKASLKAALMVTAFVAYAQVAKAQDADNDAVRLDQLANQLPPEIRAGIARNTEPYLRMVLRRLFEVAPDGQYTAQAAKSHQLRRQALVRQAAVEQLLQNDLDGDWSLSTEEIEAALGLYGASRKAPFLEGVMEADADQDMALTSDEIKAYAQKKARKTVGQEHIDLMPFDANKDGTVGPVELTQQIRALAIHLENEPKPSRENIRYPRSGHVVPKLSADCRFPEVEGEPIGIAIATHSGAAVSELTITGQDRVTYVADLVVPHGERPFYLLLGANTDTLWRVTGATERVAQVIVHERDMVAGVPGRVVTFQDDLACVPKDSKSNRLRNGPEMATALRDQTGISGLNTESPYNIGRFELGGRDELERLGELSTPEPFVRKHGKIQIQDGEKWRPATEAEVARMHLENELRRFNPRGVISIDRETVVAVKSPQKYLVMPGEAGLLQLIDEGYLEIRSGVESFVVRKPLPAVPAGLYGAHAVTFHLADGVPVPKGDLGHSAVFRLSTGDCLVGRKPNCPG